MLSGTAAHTAHALKVSPKWSGFAVSGRLSPQDGDLLSRVSRVSVDGPYRTKKWQLPYTRRDTSNPSVNSLEHSVRLLVGSSEKRSGSGGSMHRQLLSQSMKGCAGALAKVWLTGFAPWRDFSCPVTQRLYSPAELASLVSLRLYSKGLWERTSSDIVGQGELDQKLASPLLEATIRPGTESLTPGRQQRMPPPPWTPTSKLKKRKFLPRRMGFLMQASFSQR